MMHDAVRFSMQQQLNLMKLLYRSKANVRCAHFYSTYRTMQDAKNCIKI